MHGAVLGRSTSTTIRETEGGAKEHKHHHPRDGRWCLVEKPTEYIYIYIYILYIVVSLTKPCLYGYNIVFDTYSLIWGDFLRF